ncbi:coiled-coil domain-containing protein 151 [Xyrichtys novacula]|uniref:Coiled-coil domain-containing protein 151 n=1 Tax=Xyrichtys novacula TaxID=13765 RepID=A0AAV1EYU3_XYRNO|nr:coiled-coil domain-containing protein 151 [Xyrichtys novacula]
MPFSGSISSPLHDQISEMQRKIQLLEGDRTALYESCQSLIKKNRESILKLRQENKMLYRKLAQANSSDENVIKMAFQNRGQEKETYRNMSGKAALTALDQSVLSKMKRLNALKHTTQTKQRHLEELKREYQRMKPDDSSEARPADTQTREKGEEAMNLRTLKNSLEKTQFKCKEAESIMANYQKVKSHLQDEALTFQGQLDSLEEGILKHREELSNMQSIYTTAQLSKEAAKAELQKQEEQLYKERKERERVIAHYRKKVEERKAQAEKADRRGQRAAMQPDELSSEPQRSSPRMAGEEEKVISTFEEAFRRIKEAAGVTDIQEIVERFISQKETHQRLEKLKEDNEKVLLQLKEQKELLSQQFQDMKYSGEAKLSSEQQLRDECEQQLQAQQRRCDTSEEGLDCLVKTLSTVRAGVEHLADKLQHVTLTEPTEADPSPDSDEFVVELLTQCELKLQSLHEELQGKDLAAIMKEMEEEEFFIRIERKLPAYNTRVKLPEDHNLDLFQDEDESEEDEADILSREALKRQSRLIIDSKSKKKPWKKKKGKF